MNAPSREKTPASGNAGRLPDETLWLDEASENAPVRMPSNVGRYVVIGEIGRGGMGVVLRAYDPRLQREVALKSVRSEQLSSEAQALLVREARAMAQLSHPHVVAVYDVEVAKPDVLIAMEYVRGATLKDWLSQPRAWGEVVRMFLGAGRGLAAAHAVGLLHRDFKPGNVLVGDDGRARVGDFGLALKHHRTESAEVQGAALGEGNSDAASGTPRYMAPEQHDCGVLSPATDQYAFCVALWEALTGEPPFSAEPADRDSGSIAELKRTGPPAWPRQVAVPKRIRHAVCRGLSPLASDRWPDMDTLLAQLPTDSLQPARSWMFWGGIAMTLGMSGVVWNAYQQQRAERCTGGRAQVEAVWGAPQRQFVQQAFAATGLPYARGVWERVAPQLDDYASAWATMHVETCEATALAGEQPREVMDLRMACLHRAKIDLRAAAGLLAKADAQVVEKAHQVVGSLPDLDRCADLDALQAEVAPPSEAQREAVEAVRVELAEVKALREAGKYPDTLARMEPLAERSASIGYGPLQTEVQLELALAQEHAGRYADAERGFKRALRSALSSKQWSEAEFAASRLVHVVGYAQTRPSEGLVYAETAKGLLERVGEAAAADLRLHVSAALDARGHYAEAEREVRTALAIAERFWGAGHVNTAVYRRGLGINLDAQGRLPEALGELRAGLDLLEKALGPEHPEVAHAHFDVAGTLYVQGRYDEAEAEYRKALTTWETILGPEHADVAMARGSLANALAGYGRQDEARVEYEAALRIQRAALGPDHVLVAVTQVSLGTTLTILGHYAEGERHMREALRIDEKAYGPEHPIAARSHYFLTTNLLRQGRYTEAEAESRRALEIFERAGYEQPDVALTHSVLGSALGGQGRHGEGEAELRVALDLAGRLLGLEHPLVIRVRMGLGVVLAGQGRYAEAEATLREALEQQIEVLGAEHLMVPSTRGHLASSVRAQHRYEEAEAHYREAVALQEKHDTNHPDLALLQSGLGRTLVDRGKNAEGLRLYERAWSTWKDDERVLRTTRAELAFGYARALPAGDKKRVRALVREGRSLLRTDVAAERQLLAQLQAWVRTRR